MQDFVVALLGTTGLKQCKKVALQAYLYTLLQTGSAGPDHQQWICYISAPSVPLGGRHFPMIVYSRKLNFHLVLKPRDTIISKTLAGFFFFPLVFMESANTLGFLY